MERADLALFFVYTYLLFKKITLYIVPSISPPLMKILVVDDDAINRLILQKLFEKERHTVLTAENGLEAMAILISEEGVNIVITDIMMPEMDGIELLAEIKLNDKTCKLPIIGFTAGDIDYFRSITPVSFDRLLPKPMNFHELYDITHHFVAQSTA